MAKHTPLISEFIEEIHRSVLEENYQDIFRKYVDKKHGVYALYRGDQLYYVGLASNLRTRLQDHLEDRHSKSWDRFSVYHTIDGSHIKELESFVVRIANPPGNIQEGKFTEAEDLQDQVGRDFQKFITTLFKPPRKTSVKPTPTSSKNRKGRIPVLSEYINNIPAPRNLEAKFNNKPIPAMVAEDGTIRFAGKTYSSPSEAAKTACNGQSCNGWFFWKYECAPGKWVFIDQLRNLPKPSGKASVKPTPTSSKNRKGRIPALFEYINNIPAPRNLEAKFNNKPTPATVAEDGTILFAGKTYSSPSQAAKAACNGQSRNGWTFWSYKNASGKLVPLDQLRK